MPVLRSDPYRKWEEELSRHWVRWMNLTNIVVYESTGGRVAGTIPSGVPLMLLTTSGCVSGQLRTATVVYLDGADIEIPGSYFVVGSNGGLSKPPAWLGNIRNDPKVRLQIGDRRFDATGTIVDHQPTSDLVMSTLAKGYRPFSDYALRAGTQGRTIEVVELTPGPARSS